MKKLFIVTIITASLFFSSINSLNLGVPTLPALPTTTQENLVEAGKIAIDALMNYACYYGIIKGVEWCDKYMHPNTSSVKHIYKIDQSVRPFAHPSFLSFVSGYAASSFISLNQTNKDAALQIVLTPYQTVALYCLISGTAKISQDVINYLKNLNKKSSEKTKIVIPAPYFIEFLAGAVFNINRFLKTDF